MVSQNLIELALIFASILLAFEVLYLNGGKNGSTRTNRRH
jgi:hypothetical protein